MLRSYRLKGRLRYDSGISDFLEHARKFCSHVLHLGHREFRDQESHQELKEFTKFRRWQWKVVQSKSSWIIFRPAKVDDLSELLLLPALIRQRPVVLHRHFDVLAMIWGHRLATAIAAPHVAPAASATERHLDEMFTVITNIDWCGVG